MAFTLVVGFPGSSAGKESACNAGDLGWIPGLGRSPGEGKGNPLQYSHLENSMNHIVHEVATFIFTFMTEQLSLTLVAAKKWQIPQPSFPNPGKRKSVSFLC